MRILVYTAVFGGYDRVFPPLRPAKDIDYVLFTDDPRVHAAGWRQILVDTSALGHRPNRYYKMLAHRVLPGYDVSICLDGNIRPLGELSGLVESFLGSGAALGVYRHPLRSTVAAEIEACLQGRKITDEVRARSELKEYRDEGFPDADGLIETGVLLKNHNHPDLDAAMDLWWLLFLRHGTRDQISLPYVLWKTGLPCMYQPASFRLPNPHFGIYPHSGRTWGSRAYASVSAHAFGSPFHRLVLSLWHLKWSVQRRLRRSRPGA